MLDLKFRFSSLLFPMVWTRDKVASLLLHQLTWIGYPMGVTSQGYFVVDSVFGSHFESGLIELYMIIFIFLYFHRIQGVRSYGLCCGIPAPDSSSVLLVFLCGPPFGCCRDLPFYMSDDGRISGTWRCGGGVCPSRLHTGTVVYSFSHIARFPLPCGADPSQEMLLYVGMSGLIRVFHWPPPHIIAHLRSIPWTLHAFLSSLPTFFGNSETRCQRLNVLGSLWVGALLYLLPPQLFYNSF